MEFIVLHDARAAHETGFLRFNDFKTHGVVSWLVATVIPSPRSGAATVPGAYINAQTGELVAPPNSTVVIAKEGTWKVVAYAHQAGEPVENKYLWAETLDHQKRTLLPEDYYSPFTHGGTILCRPTPDATGIEKFGPVRLLFPEWSGDVADASALAEQNQALFDDGKLGPADAVQLEKLLSQDNKLLSVMAFRRLLELGRITPDLAQTQLTRAKGHLLSILVYLLLMNTGSGPGDALLQDVGDAVKTATDPNALRSIALGAFTAGLFHSTDSAVLLRSKSLVKEIQERLDLLRASPDPYMLFIIDKLGV